MPDPESRFAFAVLGTPVTISSSIPAVIDRVTVCYESLAALDTEAAVVARVMSIDDSLDDADLSSGRFVIDVAGRDPQRAVGLVETVRTLNHELLHAIMRRRLDLFYVHAAVVAVDGRAIVLPGLSRAGKSTLALALLANGAQYLSDELLAFDPDTGFVLPFARAPKVRDECLPYFGRYADAFVGTGEGRFLPLRALGPEAVANRAEPAIIAAPRWDRDGTNQLEPLTPGEGLLALTESALNFGSRGAASLGPLTALVAQAASYRVTWSEPHAVAHALRQAAVDPSGSSQRHGS